jgi:hypothetical protein
MYVVVICMLYLLDLNDFNRGNSPDLKATENDSILSRKLS